MAVATMSGTEQLLERTGKPDVIPNAIVEGIIKMIRELDVEVLQWRQFGQPMVDGIHAELQVPPRQLGVSIQKMFDFKLARNVMHFEVTARPVGLTDPAVISLEVRAGTAIR